MQRVAHAFSYRTHKIDGHEKLQASYCSAYIGIIQNHLAVKAIMSQIYADIRQFWRIYIGWGVASFLIVFAYKPLRGTCTDACAKLWDYYGSETHTRTSKHVLFG